MAANTTMIVGQVNMDALSRLTSGFLLFVVGTLIIVVIRNGGPRARYYTDLSNIRGIRRIRLTIRLCYAIGIIGIVLIISGFISALLHGRLAGAS